MNRLKLSELDKLSNYQDIALFLMRVVIAGYLVINTHYFAYFFIGQFLVKFKINDFFLTVGKLLHGRDDFCCFFFAFLPAYYQCFVAAKKVRSRTNKYSRRNRI